MCELLCIFIYLKIHSAFIKGTFGDHLVLSCNFVNEELRSIEETYLTKNIAGYIAKVQ